MKRKHAMVREERDKIEIKTTKDAIIYFLRPYRCIFCDKALSLEGFQVEDLPVSLAECESEKAPKMSIREWLTNSVNCLIVKQKGNR